MSAGTEPELWSLVRRPGQIDVRALWEALLRLDDTSTIDYRTRLLAHESLQALASHWGRTRLQAELSRHPNGPALQRLLEEQFEEEGFPSLRTHVVEATSPDSILRMLRDLGERLRQPAQIVVGGSSALILDRLLVRQTEDIDVVDELPPAIRAAPDLVDEMATRYKLRLTHFASHYLPGGWESRTRSLGRFGRLEVRVIDPLDVLAGKLFSRREKDLDDLHAAWGLIDTSSLRERIRTATTVLRSDAQLAEVARRNWYVLNGEQQLP